MTSDRTQPMALADYVHELVDTHVLREHYTTRDDGAWIPHDHRVTVPALVHQLIANDIPSAAVETGPRPGFASKPAARVDAIDLAIRIDVEAARWVRDLGADDPGDQLIEVSRTPAPVGPTCRACHHRSCTLIRHGDHVVRRVLPGSGTVACVRLLHGLSASADPVQRRAIEHDVRRWWIAARIVTGWDAPAWIPDNTCPACTERGTLRVRLADRIGVCTNDACRTVWDEATIGLLADHIRFESEDEHEPRTPPPACSVLPDYQPTDLAHLCPACGSARCVRAVGARLAAS
ncbi:hypothetical protein GCM10023340_38780 [Nocardioides marinquilinus]|uniref:DUF7341 domain-containing protein n=1 Tax=Nocardioides marinquilinus TaxID=1210400 RepID=A0ABP9PZR0_9ACTN